MALDDLLAKIQAAQGEAAAPAPGETPAPSPAGVSLPSEIPADLSGKIAAIQANPNAVPPEQEQQGWLASIGPSLMSLIPGMSSGGWGPQNWKPPAYGASDAAVHGATLGVSDIARGALGSLYGGPSMADVKTARDQYAIEHPAANLASNLAGGIGTAPLLPGAGLFNAAARVAKPFGSLAQYGATVGTGGLLGAGYGAAGGAIDEAPTGDWGKIGEGAGTGAKWGAVLGAGIPAVVGAGTGLWRGARDWLGPLTTRGDEGLVGRQIVERATDPIAARTAGEVYGPPSAPPAAPPPLRPSGFPEPSALDPSAPRLTRNLPDQAEAARQAPSAGEMVPGSRPTTAQVTGDPGIAAQERQALTDALVKPEEARTPAERELVGRSGEQATARREFFRTGIDPSADPQAFKAELQAQISAMDAQHEANINAVTAQHEANLSAAQQQLKRTETGLGQPLPPERRGADIQAMAETAKAHEKQAARDLYDAVDPSGTLKIDQSSVKADADKIVAQMPENAKAPRGEEAAILGRARLGGTAVPFTEFTALRTRLLDAIRKEREKNGESASLRRMTQLRESIDNTLTDAATSGADAGTVGRLRDANAAWRQMKETFNNQFVGPLLETRGTPGDYKVPATNVGGKIIANNESAQAFLAAGGDHETLKGALVDDLNRSLKGAELTPQKLQTWRSTREGAIRAVPGLDAEFGNVAGAQDLVGQLAQARDVAVTQATRARADAAKQARGGVVGRVLSGEAGADVQPQISSILKANPLSDTGRNATSAMMQLRRAAASNPDAEAGLQRAVMNHIDTEFINPDGTFRTAQFLKFMTEKGTALEAGLGADRMGILRTIEADLRRPGVGAPLPAGTTKAGRPGGVSAVWQAAMQGLQKPIVGGTVGPAAVLGAFGLAGGVPAAVTGVGIAGTVIARVLRANGIARRADLLAEAMGNPALTRALAMKATPANVPIIERAINAAMAGTRAAPALSFDYGEAEKQQRDRRMRQIYGLPPRAR
jgi:hypothetical protein